MTVKGGELRGYKIKPALFLYAIGLLAATKTLKKTYKKIMYSDGFKKTKLKFCD